MTTRDMPAREDILAHGFPEGFIARQRQQAHAERARAMALFLAAVFRNLDPRRRPAAARRPAGPSARLRGAIPPIHHEKEQAPYLGMHSPFV
jgi:hypothetical protein